MRLNHIHNGHSYDILRTFEDKSINCSVSSPPYFGLRDYGTAEQRWPAVTYQLFGFDVEIPEMECSLGNEDTPHQFIGHIILIYREIWRVIRVDGSVWVNMGEHG